MASVSDFNFFIGLMFWCAVAIFGFAMALTALLLVVRIRAIAHRRHIARVVAFWRGVFTGERPNLRRPISAGDAFTVLNLWNDFQRVRVGGAGVPAEALAAVASVQRFDQLARRLLARGDAGDRLVAMSFMGYLPVPGSEDDLRECARSEFGELALAAHRALIAADPRRIRDLAEAIAARADFRPRTVEQVLKAVGTHAASQPVTEVMLAAPAPGKVRLLPYFALLDSEIVHPALAALVEGAHDPEVLAAGLRALSAFALPTDRPAVLRALAHDVAFVRIAALSAIVPICAAGDREILMSLLRDPNSWVRYRAAQVLLEHFAAEDGDLRREVADRYARDALTQVLAERSVVALREFVAAETSSEDASPQRGLRVERRPMDGMRAGRL